MAKFLDKEFFTFDDVLLVPRFCEITSRLDVSFKTRLTKNIYIDAPIISANMDTITELEMMQAMHSLGCVGILHRFMDLNKAFEQLGAFEHSPMCASIGVNEDSKNRFDVLLDCEVEVVCIDVAHGDSKTVLDMIEYCKQKSEKIQIIAGNVATPQATRRLINAGADAIKVGIGPGSLCTTRIVTGNGVPQLSAIIECFNEASFFRVPIIADGGIRNSGDIVKALAAGAETVMIGSLLAGTSETPGEVIEEVEYYSSNPKKYKKYRGMASNDAMIGWKGRGYHAAPEGESKLVECKGPVENIIKTLLSGIRSGMTYQGAKNIEELRNLATFIIVSNNSVIENQPHGKM